MTWWTSSWDVRTGGKWEVKSILYLDCRSKKQWKERETWQWKRYCSWVSWSWTREVEVGARERNCRGFSEMWRVSITFIIHSMTSYHRQSASFLLREIWKKNLHTKQNEIEIIDIHRSLRPSHPPVRLVVLVVVSSTLNTESQSLRRQPLDIDSASTEKLSFLFNVEQPGLLLSTRKKNSSTAAK